MKILSIMRHGKSSWENSELDDIDRPLLKKGTKRTQRVCNYMKENSLMPDFIISSPAARAIETANIVIEELKLSLFAQISKKLYLGSVEAILDKVAEVDRNYDHVMIIGHNPVFTDLISDKAENFNIDWLPTSGLITIELKIKQWEYILGVKGKSIHYVRPKELKAKE